MPLTRAPWNSGNDYLGREFPLCHCPGNGSAGNVLIFRVRKYFQRPALHIFIEPEKIGRLIPKHDIAAGQAPAFVLQRNKNLIEFLQLLRIAFGLERDILVGNRSNYIDVF